MKTKKRNYQLIFWFPVWQGFHFYRMTHKNRWSLIYEWFLYLGFWELRKLQSNSEEALKNLGKLIVHPTLKTLGYYKDGKFVKILTRKEYEELEIIKGDDKK